MARAADENASATSAQRRRAQKQAKIAAQAAVINMKCELQQWQAKCKELQDIIEVACQDATAERLVAAAPALAAKLGGQPPAATATLRRNVAMHSEAAGISLLTADRKQLAKAQRGPRLELRAGEHKTDGKHVAADSAHVAEAQQREEGRLVPQNKLIWCQDLEKQLVGMAKMTPAGSQTQLHSHMCRWKSECTLCRPLWAGLR